jgi:2-aminoethylphosphonate transport system ATP-binding protein
MQDGGNGGGGRQAMALDLLVDGLRVLPRGAAPVGLLAGGIDFEDSTVSDKHGVRLSHLHLAIRPGEVFALVGPPGAGKTAALRALAGLERLTGGRVKVGGLDVTARAAQDRPVALVDGHERLAPRRRLGEHVALGLRSRYFGHGSATRDRVALALSLAGLEGMGDRPCADLSPAQCIRAGIARALAAQPRTLLLDEPFGALDGPTRRHMLEELARLHGHLPALTLLYATHDPAEALALADRLAVLREGRLVACGPAQRLYRRPPNRFTAELLGRANLLEVTIASHAAEGLVRVRFGTQDLLARDHPTLGFGNRCLLCVRPHETMLQRPSGASNALRCRVVQATWQGDRQDILLETGGVALRAVAAPLQPLPAPGEALDAFFRASHGVLIPAELPV